VNIAQDYLTNPYGGFPTMVAHPTEGGYTSLLLGPCSAGCFLAYKPAVADLL
jgi:hypothetical protein